MKHICGYFIPYAGALREEKSRPFDEIPKKRFGSYRMLKIESSNFVMMSWRSLPPTDDGTE
jgi:hypothetical protein